MLYRASSIKRDLFIQPVPPQNLNHRRRLPKTSSGTVLKASLLIATLAASLEFLDLVFVQFHHVIRELDVILIWGKLLSVMRHVPRHLRQRLALGQIILLV